MNNQDEVRVKQAELFKVPHSYVIVMSILILASILTYLIPAGEFFKFKNDIGKTVIDASQFKYIEQTSVSIFRIPNLIVKSMSKQSSIIFALLIIGGSFEIVLKTGMFQAYLTKLSKKFSKKGLLLVPLFMLMFGVLGMTQAANKFIAFAPVGVLLSKALGYDAIVGVALVLLGSGIGFSTGILQPTTAIAQEIAELPVYSGMWLRVVSFILFYGVTLIYIISYCKKIKKDPSKSLVYDIDFAQSSSPTDAYIQVEKKHLPILVVVVAAFGIVTYGSVKYGWSFDQMAVVFIWMGIVVGFLNKNSPSEISKTFINGAKGMLGASLVVGLGAAVGMILSEGNILDTVVKLSSSGLMALPVILRGPGMMIAQVIVNIFVTSGSGQAAITMPVMVPLADLSGVTRQTAVLAFKFGDGFCNYILPHATAVMGYLGVVGVPDDRWLSFFWKLFVLWLGLGAGILMFATIINYV
ncbi:MAG: YfcC family protein [Cetobacterium sp.]|uniref:YfcC family protein n=1 Tax=Cetobacterium sp. TaxID=2071632 RepID=UPI003EE4FBAD